MYFQVLKSLGVCLFIMTILSMPSLIFAYFGKRIPEEDYDGLGLYQFTVGNIGYNQNSPTYFEDSACKRKNSLAPLNDTCIHLPNDLELSLTSVGTILTASEIMQTIVFFITIWYLKKRLIRFDDEMSREITAVTDYAIMVQHIPKDTTPEHIIAHFSNLYPLDKLDWAKRPPLSGARPVQQVCP